MIEDRDDSAEVLQNAGAAYMCGALLRERSRSIERLILWRR